MRDITPKHMRCPAGYCESIISDGEAYLIIGKKVETIPPELLGRIGPDELLIAVPKRLIDEREQG